MGETDGRIGETQEGFVGTAIEMPNDSVLSCVETEEDSRYIVTTHTLYDYKGKRIKSKTDREIITKGIPVFL